MRRNPRRILVNDYERQTFDVLCGISEEEGCRVFPKVRLADVFSVNQSGISNTEFSYALKAHFDFVICDVDTLPLFAVEFDEPHHQNDPDTIERDKLKFNLCEKFGFPLLRIEVMQLNKIASKTLLEWIVDVWFRAKDFCEAQIDGQIPYDEVFIYSGILEPQIRDQDGTWRELDQEIDDLSDLMKKWDVKHSDFDRERYRDPFMRARAKLAALEKNYEWITGHHFE